LPLWKYTEGVVQRIGKSKPVRHFIREWMETKGVDNRRLADRMDVGEGTISKLLNGHMKMTLEYLAEIAGCLDIEVDQLFRDPKAPTRDELLRGYSNEELTSALQLIEHSRSRATGRATSASGKEDDLGGRKEPRKRGVASKGR
jgi:transcriptional regulator with XRE-family HTH domain